jgi:hypothetical protein
MAAVHHTLLFGSSRGGCCMRGRQSAAPRQVRAPQAVPIRTGGRGAQRPSRQWFGWRRWRRTRCAPTASCHRLRRHTRRGQDPLHGTEPETSLPGGESLSMTRSSGGSSQLRTIQTHPSGVVRSSPHSTASTSTSGASLKRRFRSTPRPAPREARQDQDANVSACAHPLIVQTLVFVQMLLSNRRFCAICAKT